MNTHLTYTGKLAALLFMASLAANASATTETDTKNKVDTEIKNETETKNEVKKAEETALQQQKKSSTEQSSDRGIMLNAKSTTEPRQVEIGLPMTYTAVMFNGLPSVYYYWPNTTSNHWRSEQLFSKQGMLDMPHVAITEGEIGYGVDSWAELGGDTFKGKVKYGVNTFGSQNVDINLSGPLGKGWSYTASAYNNFDPGCFKIKFAQYVDRSQFYTGGLTKHWDNGAQLTFMYKHTDVHNLSSAANYAPFQWNSDGSVTTVNGFKIGRDSYLPVDGQISYIDVRTGESKTTSLYDGIHAVTNEGSVYFDTPLRNGWNFSVRGKISHSEGASGDMVATGVLNTADGVKATYTDGRAYSGLVQGRTLQFNNFQVNDALFTAQMKAKKGYHDWIIGLDELHTNIHYARSTAALYHEVAANPEKLLINGATSAFSNFNNGSEYDYGNENKLAGYVFDKWEPTYNFRLNYGVRLEWFHANVDNIANSRSSWSDANGTHYFYLGGTDANGNKIETTAHNANSLNYAITLAPKWNITDAFGLTAEGNFLKQHRHLEAYSGTSEPLYSARNMLVGQAGIFYNAPWINLVSAFTYASQNHNYNRLYVTNPNDATMTEMVANTYSIKTIGWTTDAVFHPFKGFQFHARVTLQSPKYGGYSFNTSWKDYSFQDMVVTKTSKFLLELDPRYSIGRFSVWANFRYYSKQYVNVGNSVFFKGRWETFGGMSYNVNKYLTLNANVTNFLGQSGAQGTIPSSDTVEDASKLNGTVLAGNYILPFQVMFSAQIKF